MGYRYVANESGKEVYRFTKDDPGVIKTALIAEKASLKRYLELEERCTSTRLREVIWGLIESRWGHLSQWRDAYKAIREKIFLCIQIIQQIIEKCTCPVPYSLWYLLRVLSKIATPLSGSNQFTLPMKDIFYKSLSVIFINSRECY